MFIFYYSLYLYYDIYDYTLYIGFWLTVRKKTPWQRGMPFVPRFVCKHFVWRGTVFIPRSFSQTRLRDFISLYKIPTVFFLFLWTGCPVPRPELIYQLEHGQELWTVKRDLSQSAYLGRSHDVGTWETLQARDQGEATGPGSLGKLLVLASLVVWKPRSPLTRSQRAWQGTQNVAHSFHLPSFSEWSCHPSRLETGYSLRGFLTPPPPPHPAVPQSCPFHILYVSWIHHLPHLPQTRPHT